MLGLWGSKPLVLQVPPEREEIYNQLKEMFYAARRIADDERKKTNTRIKAMRLAAYIAQVILGYMKEAEIDEIKRQLDELEKE